MERFGIRSPARKWGVAAVLVAVSVAVAVAAATAQATPNKPYTANVHRTLNTPGSFTFTLTNDPHASQSLGSANFTPPVGVMLTVGEVGTNVTRAGWTVSVDSLGIVEFRSNSGSDALGPGQSVSGDVTFTKTAACTATPGSATWQVEAKQSNDFSGSPGNGMTQGPSDLTPLGSFGFAPVETVVDGASGPIHVPQILTSPHASPPPDPTPLSITAYDTCGNVDADYSGAGATLAPVLGPLNGTLTGATITTPAWSGGSWSPTLAAVNVEARDQLLVSDPVTGISQPSNEFDVVEKICAVPGTVCTWSNPKNTITAVSTVPADSNGQASLGLGFKAFLRNVTCSGKGPLGDSIQIDPYQYTDPYTIVLTYSKSIVPRGPASSIITCKSFDNGQTWDPTPIPPCQKTPAAPCADPENIAGGNLQITLYLMTGDPHSGGFG